MNAANTSTAIRQFILDRFPSSRRRPLEDTDPLIENGIVDSLGVLDVVAFIESAFGVVVDDEELVPENFQTVSKIAAYVERKNRERT
jgi:acyl carrier protein